MNYGLRVSFALIGLLIFGTQTWGQQSGDELVVRPFGFKISRPDKGWDFQQSKSPKPGSLVLKISKQGAGGATQVTVVAESAGDNDPLKRRDRALGQTKANDAFSKRKQVAFKIAGQDAPGFQLDWKTAGQDFRVQQCYVASQGILYTVAVHSPVDKFEKLEPTFRRARESFQIVPIDDDVQRQRQLQALAARCGSELSWAKSWEEAAAKARAEKKSILVAIRLQPGFTMSDPFNAGIFMDRDIIDLIGEHCIPLRFRKGMKTPLASHDFYGMSPSSLGGTILLCEPDGTVFGDTFTPETVTFHEFLLEHLPKRSQVKPPPELKGIELAEWHSRRGELKKALQVLSSAKTAREHLLRASIFRRQRLGNEALAELAKARKVGGEELEPEIAVSEAGVQLKLGQIAKAVALLESVVNETPDIPHASQAKFLLGVCRLATDKPEEAKKLWSELTEADDDNRWAWQAAGVLQTTVLKLGLRPQLNWPTDDVIAAMRSPVFESRKVAELEIAEKEATKYLLTRQRENGTWISPADSVGARGFNTKTFTIAVTSICGRSLISLGEREPVKQALAKSIDFVIAAAEEHNAERKPRFFMDYSPWGSTYALLFLSDCVAAELVEKDKAAAAIDSYIDHLGRHQKSGGGWSYYLSHDISKIDQPSNQSISFMTAAVVISLITARDAEFDVPKATIHKGLDCLERMRNKNRTFEYFLWHEREGEGQRGRMSEEGAVGRGPLCALALYKGGRGSFDEIRDCLDLFLKHRAAYAGEKGKSLMHSGLGSQGSHYLMFDYAWTAAAIAQLPKDDRPHYRTPLLEQILDARSTEGSYLDNPINGWHYGTGMALHAIRQLR